MDTKKERNVRWVLKRLLEVSDGGATHVWPRRGSQLMTLEGNPSQLKVPERKILRRDRFEQRLRERCGGNQSMKGRGKMT